MVGASRHARMHAIDASFGDRWGCAVAYANPLGHCMLLPEGDALPERIKQKASADDELLGGVEPGMHAGWLGRDVGNGFPSPIDCHRLSARSLFNIRILAFQPTSPEGVLTLT